MPEKLNIEITEAEMLDDQNSYLRNGVRIAKEPINGSLTTEFVKESKPGEKADENNVSAVSRAQIIGSIVERLSNMPSSAEMSAFLKRRNSNVR